MVKLSFALPVLLAFSGVFASLDVNAASTEQSLINDIQKSQQALAKTTEQIRAERRQLGKALFKQSQAVEKLREQAAVAQRVLDEQNLSLSTLEKRLQTWKEQAQYQQHMLSTFARDVKVDTGSDFEAQLDALNVVAKHMAASLAPQWQSQSLVLTDGKIEPGHILDLGPVKLYQHSGEVGLASFVDNTWRAEYAYSDTQSASWRGEKNAQLVFDPSQSRALLQAQTKETVYQHLTKGGVWVIPIVLFALFALCIAAYKALQLWRLPSLPSVAGLRVLQSSPERFAGMGIAGQLLHVWHQFAPGQQRDDELYNTLLAAREKLERYVGAIAITASVAPLLGLLGTVSGMIDTFKMMTLFGAGDPQVVSGGISQALITTELGLVVAIPALICHALLNRKVKSYYHQLESIALSLSQQVVNAENTAKEAA
ncbi:MotA/TolQ/ExbB proton channel family protein [Pseudoalteromonas xiamenensis]